MFDGITVVTGADKQSAGLQKEIVLPNQWQVVFTRRAQKDSRNLGATGLRAKAEFLLEVLRVNPFQSPPAYEILVGDLAGAFSRRINIQPRLVYEVDQTAKVVKVIRMWTRYE